MKTRNLITTAIVAVTTFGLLLFLGWRALQDEYGVSIASVRWLPPEALNIKYIRFPMTHTMAEFEIEQAAFEAWGRSKKMPMRRLLSNESRSIPRCLFLLERKGLIPVVPEPGKESVEEWSPRYGHRYRKSLGKGDLHYVERWDNGGGYALGYDVEEGKGYYWFGHH